MSNRLLTYTELERENSKLREQLSEAENTLDAIRYGAVDAFVVLKSGNPQIVTLREADYLYRILVESMNEGAVTLVPDGTIFYTNQRFAEIVQLPAEQLIGTSFYKLTNSKTAAIEDLKTIINEKDSVRLESDLASSKGEKIPVELSAHILETEDVTGYCIVVTDISERKQIRENLRFLGSHDTLSGLYNRNFFEEEMDRLEKGRQYPISVIEIDIDGLKLINDQFGHSTGDEYIKRMAMILKEVFRADDIIARIGGDEFAVLLPNVDSGTVHQLGKRIRTTQTKQNLLHPDSPLEFSLGVATAEKNDSLSKVLKRADEQMYLNKKDEISD